MSSVLRWKHFWLAMWILGMGIGMYLSIMPTTPREVVIPHLDKLIHGSSYALLAIFAACIFDQKRARWKALLWLVFYGGLIEIAQGALPTGRTMEFADFIANSVGVAIGAFVALRWNLLRLLERTLQFSRPMQ